MGEAFDRVIPQWDGRVESIRQHKEDVSWWLAGVDLSKIASFNLAARYVRRQQHPGVAARLRALKPTDLEFTRAKYVDTDGSAVTADAAGAILDTPAIYDAGVWKAMTSLEKSIFVDKTSKRHELRDAFYRDMRRQPGERVDSFQIRFGKELADLDALEVRFEDADKAYFFRDRLNLGKDSQRYELLDTATGADPSYETLTTHAKRLFSAVHLHERSRQFPSGSGASTSSSSAPPTGRPAVAYRRFTGRPPPPFTGRAPRGAPPRGSPGLRRDAGGRFQPGRGGGGRGAQRQVKFEHANEAYGDEHQAEPDDADGDEGDVDEPLCGADPGLGLEAALQHEPSEAAHEADTLEAAGEEPEIVDALDESAQRVAEALILLRTARAKASAVKKDRKGGFPAAAGRSASPAATRSSGWRCESTPGHAEGAARQGEV